MSELELSVSDREKVLQVAELLFAEHGFPSVSLSDVAARGGVSIEAASGCFSDARELFDTVIENALTPLGNDVLAALAQTAPLLDRLQAAADVWIDHVGRHPTLVSLLLQRTSHDMVELRGEVIPHVLPMMSAAARALGRQQADPGSEGIDSTGLISIVAGAAVLYIPRESLDTPRTSLSAERLGTYRDELAATIARRLQSKAVRRP